MKSTCYKITDCHLLLGLLLLLTLSCEVNKEKKAALIDTTVVQKKTSITVKLKPNSSLIFNAFLPAANYNFRIAKECTIALTIQKGRINKIKGKALELYRYVLDDEAGPVLIKRIIIHNNPTIFHFHCPEPYSGFIRLNTNDTNFLQSSPYIFSNELIRVYINLKESDVVVKSFQNNFLDENRMLLFRIPYEIISDANYRPEIVKKNYELPKPWTFEGILGFYLAEYENTLIKLVKQYQQYYRSLEAFYAIRSQISPKTLDLGYAIFEKNFPNTHLLKMLADYIQNEKDLVKGKRVKDFQVEDSNKKIFTFSKSEYAKHRYTFLDFWASWCGGCREEMALFKTKYNQIDTSKIRFVSISIDKDDKRWIIAYEQENTPWESYIDPGRNKNILSNKFCLTQIPKNFLIDEDGNLIETDLHDEKLDAFFTTNHLWKSDDK